MKLYKAILFLVISSFAFSSSDYTIRSKYTNIHYDDVNQDVAVYISENIDTIVEELLAKFNASNLPIIDVSIYSDKLIFNAAADTLNEPAILYFHVPFTPNELIDNDNYILDTLRHELAHSLSARITSEAAAEYSKFMQHPLFTPNAVVPSGFQEGMAQVIESQSEKETGRAFGYNSYYNSLWLSEWRNGFISFSDFAALHEVEGHVRAYLYGAYFFSYVTNRFGDAAIADWLQARSNDINAFANPILGLSYSWQQAFDEPLQDTWHAFREYESAKLSERYGYNEEPAAKILNESVGSYRNEANVSIFNEGDSQYYIAPLISFGKTRFGFYENGTKKETFRLPWALQVELISKSALYFLQYGECKGKESLNVVYFDIETETQQPLTQCGQVLTFDANSDTIVTLEKDGSGSVIKTLNLQGEEMATHWQGGFAQQVSALRLSPNGETLLLSLKPSLEGVWNLYELDLASNAITQLTDDTFIQRSPSYVSQTEVVYSREYNGIEQIFHLDMTTGTETQVTNHNYGVLKPIFSNDEIITLSLKGFDLQLQSEPFRMLEASQQFGPAKAITLDATDTNEAEVKPVLSQPYRFVESFKLQGILPLPNYSTDDGLEMLLVLLAVDAKREHLFQYQAKIAIGNGATSHLLSYNFKSEFGVKLQSAKQDDALTNGYNVYSKKGHLIGLVNVTPVLNATTLQTYKDGDIIEQQWLGAGLAVSKLEGCKAFTAACSGWQAAAFAENKNGFKELGQENNARLVSAVFVSLGNSMAVKVGLDSRYAFDGNQFNLGVEDNPQLLTPLISTNFEQRGYDAPLQGEWLSQIDARITKQWAPSRALGTIGVSLDTVNLTPYLATGFDDSGNSQMTAGVELGAQSTLGWNIPFAFSAGYANGLSKGGSDEWYLSLGANF